jgi:anti-anti-sigma regulatory factor
MAIRVEPRPEGVVVKAERRLVVANRLALRAAVLGELGNGRPCVVIDFSGTELIDSGGLGLLVTLHRCAVELGARLILANLPNTKRSVPSSFKEEMTALMHLTKLDSVLTVAGTVDEALAVAAAQATHRSYAPVVVAESV